MNIPEMIMTILITVGIGKFSEYQSPKYYELETVDGNVYNVKVEKNHKYACPLHCKADHYHNVILTGSKEAMSANYDSPKNKSFELFQSKIGYFTKSHSSSMGNRTSSFNNGDKPIQKYYFIDAEDSSKLSAAFKNYGKYRPKNHQALFGSITSREKFESITVDLRYSPNFLLRPAAPIS